MFDDDVVSLIFVSHTQAIEELVGRLSENHGREELTAEPATTAWGDGGFDDGDLEIGTGAGEDVSGGETAGSGSDDDNVRLGIRSLLVLEH